MTRSDMKTRERSSYAHDTHRLAKAKTDVSLKRQSESWPTLRSALFLSTAACVCWSVPASVRTKFTFVAAMVESANGT